MIKKRMVYRGRTTICSLCGFCGVWKPTMEIETLMRDGQRVGRCIKCTCKTDPAFGELKVNALGYVK